MHEEVLTIQENGTFSLPDEIVEQYHFKRENKVRIIRTKSGILLVPLTDAPMDAELTSELADWQSISADSWDLFRFDEVDR
jgi:bifunctional DNA-binding transcriptional regulator/antitoxin component of YhaV-PrlF toxin-antitoxin module